MRMTCHGCGAQLPDRARFCPECGRSAHEQSNGREARRIVTALFFDTVGSTALGERLDPEDLQLLIGAGVDRMVATAEAFGGTARTPSGDGGMVLFGAPVAHEDDPERAVRAGLRIVEEMAAYSSEVRSHWGLEALGVRVGIETGLVALSAVGGAGGTGAMGDALNTAARLEAAAPPGGVVVGERTRRVVEHLFRWDGPLDLELKGKSGTVRAWRAIGAVRGVPRRLASRVPLIGRNEEMGQAVAAIEETLAGSGRIVTVRGEAGMGKSRILEELRSAFERGGGRWLEGRAISYGATLTLHPFADLLSGIDAGVDALLPEADVPPELAQERTFARVARVLAEAAQETPIAVVLDDLHWADPSSVALCETLLELPQRAAMALVLASRPVPDHGSAAVLRAAHSRPGLCAVELPGLSRPDEVRLLGMLLTGGPLRADLAEEVLGRAGGNPLYLEELVRALQRAEPDRGAVELPETIEKLILSRVDLLADADRGLAGAAAVLGRTFDTRTLRAVAGDADVAALVVAELVEPVAGDVFQFRHPLVQEAVYGSLLKRRRQQLHHAVARVLEEQLHPEPVLIAQHCVAAGDDDRAVDHYLAAAASAEAQGAMLESKAHADAAIAAAERIGRDETDPRVAEALRRSATGGWTGGSPDASKAACERAIAGARRSGDLRGQIEGLVRLAIFSRASNSQSRAVELYAEAAAIAERLGDEDALANTLAGLAMAQSLLLDFASASATARRAADAADRAGSSAARAAALDAEKLIAFQLGEVDALDRAIQRLLELVLPSTDGSFEKTHGMLRHMFALLESTFVSIARGDLAEARRRADGAYELNRRSGMRTIEMFFMDAQAWVARAAGEPARAAEIASRAVEVSGRWAEQRSWARATLGAVLLEGGQIEEAAEVLRVGVAVSEPLGTVGLLRCACLLADALSRLADERAPAAVAKAQAIFDRVRTPPDTALLFAGDAILALARAQRELGDVEAGEALAEPVLRAAARTGWWLPVGQTAWAAS